MWGGGVEGWDAGAGHACEALAAWLKMGDVGLVLRFGLFVAVDCLMCR